MRLNFSFVEPERIRRGIELLSEVIRERMELRSDLERGSHRSVGARARPSARTVRLVARLAVLRGGHSMERDVSFVTGRRVQHALERLGHEVHPLDIEDQTTGTLMELGPDAAFICLHGPGGEDGTVQALLETLGIPYTGSGPLSSIRCMDKDYAKRALRANGIQTPPFRTFLRKAMNEMGASAALEVAADDLGYPLVVKPAREGSSFGLSRVEGPDGLLDAVYEALGYDAKILLESWVEGTEISIPIIEPAGEDPRALGLVEIRPREGAYNFEAKYTPGATDFAIPAEIPPEDASRVEETALTAYRVLGCSGYARVDTIFAEGTPWVLDVKTIPGFTETSTFPLAAEAAGITFEKLVETILDAALHYRSCRVQALALRCQPLRAFQHASATPRFARRLVSFAFRASQPVAHEEPLPSAAV